MILAVIHGLINIPILNMTTFYWDSVGTYPSNTSWTSGTSSLPSTYNNPELPNSLGYPLVTNFVTGSAGWEVDTGYNNTLNTVNTSIVRYPGRASLHFVVNPFTPVMPTGLWDSGVSGAGTTNYRSEIALDPWHYLYSVPSEFWLSWSYYFPTLNSVFDAYVDPNYPTTDNSAEGLIHQLHCGNGGPVVQLWVHASWGNKLLLTILSGDEASPTEYAYNTQYPLVAGQWMDFVEHVQWSTTSSGLYELWCTTGGTTTQLVSHTGANTYSNPEDGNGPYGGTPKFGIYHHVWHSLTNTFANSSLTAMSPQTQLEQYMGPVKFLYRSSPSTYVGEAGYTMVKP